NRQAIFERCQVEISRAERFRRPLTLIMLDLNSFKMINDRAGHPAGDEVLRRTAEVLADTVRLYDLVGRLGGDEFIVLLPEAGTDAAQIVVERLQAALRLTIETAFPPVTFSIGAVTWLSPPDNVAECLAAVDRMLYSAKQSGDGSAKFATISGPAGNPANP
ncbi:MAG: GGDEF domain-containing protein, partial [Planctomycetaceae bacterium]